MTDQRTMKILILTQKVDERDPVLGFMTGWIREFASKFEAISVVCLEKGVYTLPSNVQVFSLGKEQGESRFRQRIRYVWRFFKCIWHERKNYDAVFVHMNEEYVLLGGIFWKIFGKRIFMWRNHYAGSWKTNLAAAFCDKVFCTSKSSYTAKFKKTVLMPVGVDVEIFKPTVGVERKKRSIIFFARMSESKRPGVLLDALRLLMKRGADFSAKFYGNPPPAEKDFYEKLKQSFPELERYGMPGVSNADAPRVFSEYEIFVNLSRAGMYDKTLFEAAACGCLVLAVSPDFAELVGDERFQITDLNPEAIADKLEKLLNLPDAEKFVLSEKFRAIAAGQDLQNLAVKLAEEISENNKLHLSVSQRVKKHNLPMGEYVVVGGAMEAHGIRKAKDLDIVVTSKLFGELIKKGWNVCECDKCKEKLKAGIKEQIIKRDGLDILSEYSWYDKYHADTTYLIKNADIVDGVPFVQLEELVKWKKACGRPKDIHDIELIEQYLASQKQKK